MMFSTSKWIRSWYGRKRRSQRKATGILAIKTEVGDPMISASTAGAVSDIQSQPQPQPVGPANENTPVVARKTEILDAGSVDTSRIPRSPLTPSRRYAPYMNSKTASTFPSDDLQPHSFNNVQDHQPSAESRHLVSHNNVPLPLIQTSNNDTPAMFQRMDHGHNALYTLFANSDSPSNFSYPAAYSPKKYDHESPASINLLPAFDAINDDMPIPIPAPIQDIHTSLAPPVNIGPDLDTLLAMDDSTFISFARGRDETEKEFQLYPEMIDFDRPSRYLKFPEHPSHSSTNTYIDIDHHSSIILAPFAHLRQEEEDDQPLTKEVENIVSGHPSVDDVAFSAFGTPPKTAIDLLQPGSPKMGFTFPSSDSDTLSTLPHFPVTPVSVRLPILNDQCGIISENPSPSSGSSLHQYQTNVSFSQFQLSPLHQQQPSIPPPALTSKNSNPNDTNDINSELRSADHFTSVALHALATEEDTFTAAIMLVMLSKAGFVWDC